jgi:hypothetical protein
MVKDGRGEIILIIFTPQELSPSRLASKGPVLVSVQGGGESGFGGLLPSSKGCLYGGLGGN